MTALRPYSGNARTHSRKQVRQIADSIKRFGFTNPVLIGDDGEIIAGHGRVMAAKELCIAAVPTVKLSHLIIQLKHFSFCLRSEARRMEGARKTVLAKG